MFLDKSLRWQWGFELKQVEKELVLDKWMGGSFGWVTGDRGWSEVAGGGVGILGKVRCPLTECKLSMNVQTTIEFLKLILAVPCYYFRSWGKQAELSCTWVILCWMTSIVRVSSFHQFLNLVLQVTLGLSASIGGYDASQRAFRLSSSPSMCEYRSSLCYVAGMVLLRLRFIMRLQACTRVRYWANNQ